MKSKKMSQQDLSAFCKQIALILQAGISCYEGISIMKDGQKCKVVVLIQQLICLI